MARHCYVLRVFTRDGVGGNHLGVVTDMSGLGEDDLQDIATELGYSETIYLDWRNRDMPKVRIFTPGAELPFAGHPLVGMTWLLNRLGPGGTGEIECGIGRVRSRMDGDAAWIDASLDQPVTLDAALPATCEPGLAALGVVPEHVAIVEMPIPYHVAELADSDAVRAVVTPQEGMVSFYSWVDDSTVHTRFFAPGHGVAEDPATGSAAVALAASLRARGRGRRCHHPASGRRDGIPVPDRVALVECGSVHRWPRRQG